MKEMNFFPNINKKEVNKTLDKTPLHSDLKFKEIENNISLLKDKLIALEERYEELLVEDKENIELMINSNSTIDEATALNKMKEIKNKLTSIEEEILGTRKKVKELEESYRDTIIKNN